MESLLLVGKVLSWALLVGGAVPLVSGLRARRYANRDWKQVDKGAPRAGAEAKDPPDLWLYFGGVLVGWSVFCLLSFYVMLPNTMAT